MVTRVREFWLKVLAPPRGRARVDGDRKCSTFMCFSNNANRIRRSPENNDLGALLKRGILEQMLARSHRSSASAPRHGIGESRNPANRLLSTFFPRKSKKYGEGRNGPRS